MFHNQSPIDPDLLKYLRENDGELPATHLPAVHIPFRFFVFEWFVKLRNWGLLLGCGLALGFVLFSCPVIAIWSHALAEEPTIEAVATPSEIELPAITHYSTDTPRLANMPCQITNTIAQTGRIFAQPSFRSEKIAEFTEGDILQITGEADHQRWYEVQLQDGTIGWMYYIGDKSMAWKLFSEVTYDDKDCQINSIIDLKF